ncbi:MAG: hypothetical protein EXR47_08255 [Dehalococcoidia bacterium]|nr:hypothetical protein [Dehalococcoidia bacterium]
MSTSRALGLEETTRLYVKKSLITFLERNGQSKDRDLQNLSWVVGVVRSSGVRGEHLATILSEIQSEGASMELGKVIAECQRQRWC